MSPKRVIVAIVLLAITFGCVAAGGVYMAIYLALFIYAGLRELVDIAKAKGLNTPYYFSLLSIYVLLALSAFELYELLYPTFAGIMIVAFLFILFRGKNAKLNDVTMTMFAIIYGGIFPIHFLMLRNLSLGYVLLMVVIISMCDIGAYYSGKLLGKTPLWKEVSPKKTIEGSVGGTLIGVASSVLVGHFIGLHIAHSIIVGLIITVLAQLGDLAESMIKRDVGVKDSGTVFPGHGGALDRADSYIFTVVGAFYYFWFFVAG